MKGLILKDLLNLRKQARIILLFVGFYFVLGMINQSGDSFGGVVALLFAMLAVTAMAYDERAGWDKYALTMPVSRRDLVVSKYLLGVLLSLAGLVPQPDLPVCFCQSFVGGWPVGIAGFVWCGVVLSCLDAADQFQMGCGERPYPDDDWCCLVRPF